MSRILAKPMTDATARYRETPTLAEPALSLDTLVLWICFSLSIPASLQCSIFLVNEVEVHAVSGSSLGPWRLCDDVVVRGLPVMVSRRHIGDNRRHMSVSIVSDVR